ncbi:MAG: hypothetical protein ABSG31_05955 [Tepidisphaeraceae bacterium]|jgi:predicted nucleic acid-binding protein
MKYLVDTNVWLQAILGRSHAHDVVRPLNEVKPGLLATTDFTLHTVGIRVTPTKPDQFISFLDDLIARRVNTLHLAASDLRAVVKTMQTLDSILMTRCSMCRPNDMT